MDNNIELLAPVGSIESLYAAVQNGADAVYLGGKLFNARKYASNFDDEELREAVKYAHIYGVKVYVTVNILLDDNELNEVVEYLTYLYNIDVDAIIIQDLGLGKLIKELFPDIEIHASTQMTINNFMGVKFLEEFGFKRAVLARELSVDDIRYIKDKTNLELEGFVHGALCVSYSGQCLMSSLIGGRSGNRGTCAQPCRMNYSIVRMNDGKVLNDEVDNKYLLSPKDLNTIDYLSDIVEAGITSLKIEGRMKKPEYVATIVSNYKRALNHALKGNKTSISEQDKKDIAQAFNRGFTKGHIMKDFGRAFISYDKPNNRGVLVGQVVMTAKESVYIRLQDSLHTGDGIEIINTKGKNQGTIVQSMHIDGRQVQEVKRGQIAGIDKLRGVGVNSQVYKTSDKELLKRAQETYLNKEKIKQIGIYMAIHIAIGSHINLHIWDDAGNYVTIASKEKVELARKVALTVDSVEKQLEKLGDTSYYSKSIDVDLEEQAMVPIRVLNQLRREGIDKLSKKRGNLNNRIEINKIEVQEIANKLLYNKDKKPRDNKKRKISIKVNEYDQFMRLNPDYLDRVYLNYKENLQSSIERVKAAGKEVYIATDKIVENGGFKDIERILSHVDIEQIDGISSSNLGTLKFIKDNYETNIHCDIGLNIFNSITIKALEGHGLKSFTFSPELKLSQIAKMNFSPFTESESLVYGYLPLMVTKYCPLSLVKNCESSRECHDCNLKEGYGLLDRKGMVFELSRRGKTTIIYNSQPLMVLEHIDSIYDSHVDYIRLDFTKEREGIEDIQRMYYRAVKGVASSAEIKSFVDRYKKLTGITKGHYYRGVN